MLEFASGARPDLRAAAVIGRTMRDALMCAWPDPIPGWLSGHAPDGAPSREPHLAVAPLANVGFGWSDGSWHGLALILPRASRTWLRAETPAAFAERRQLDLALAGLPKTVQSAVIPLHLGKLGTTLLRVVSVPEKESLRPRRYIGPSRLWSTATPIALDRHPKTADPRAEAVDAIAASCARIGLPAPIAVQVHKHAAVAGAPSAWPAGGSPRWEGWARPARSARARSRTRRSFSHPLSSARSFSARDASSVSAFACPSTKAPRHDARPRGFRRDFPRRITAPHRSHWQTRLLHQVIDAAGRA